MWRAPGASALLSGCGYHAVWPSAGRLAEANGVNVILFTNRSYRPGVEGVLARDLVDELALRTGGNVLSGDQAQLELTGASSPTRPAAVSYTAQDTIKEYRAVITVQATLREAQTQKVALEGRPTEDQVFPVNRTSPCSKTPRTPPSAKICRKLSEEIWQKASRSVFRRGTERVPPLKGGTGLGWGSGRELHRIVPKLT